MWDRVDQDYQDDAHFTAEAALGYFLSSRGLTEADLSANPVVVAAFQPALHRRLLRLTNARPAPHWVEPERCPLSHGEANGWPVSVILLPVGAPWTVLLCEQLIHAGARAIIAAGAAGSLQESAPYGSLVIPTQALRDEGTSYHYAPPESPAVAHAELVEALASECRRRGVEPHLGTGWTTDGVFRETGRKVQRMRGRGVVSVDMEASAMFVLGGARGVQVASLFIVSDELFHPWRPAFQEKGYAERVTLAAEVVVAVAGRWAARFPRGAATGVQPAPTPAG